MLTSSWVKPSVSSIFPHVTVREKGHQETLKSWFAASRNPFSSEHRNYEAKENQVAVQSSILKMRMGSGQE
jgi:hypothetical protein